ncbi:MAG: Crp/Fnr family transcriptional regulator [Microcoleus sp. SIO2G3]|nr:Crp/Fnr family transcriptional regulator [Microcoleus sp. SIO2G3]
MLSASTLSASTFFSPSLKQTFKRGNLIPQEQHCLWRIEQGIVRTTLCSEEGVLIISGYWGANDVIGQLFSCANDQQFECLTAVEISPILSRFWHEEFDAVCRHAQQTEELLRIVQQQRVYQRLLQLFVWFARKFGAPVEQGVLIDLLLSHQELAETIGTTRVTVTRVVQQLEQEGIITRLNRKYVLLQSGTDRSQP